ncbi:hypothetical protein LUZ63_016045 [Rhynchospora breviuscula]|uniref:Glucose/Sorbosone dehydrogenase domain-containing protein n=1 Tax=Rhynchospora breviuscula TaxID=2022672 RepID=A0A9Q0HND0_9POAL|nr:hypothetical protein LUZ63_016045 [Rhynchospora breviuscula]
MKLRQEAMMLSLLPFLLVLFLPCFYSLPLCTDSMAPITLKTPLKFCSYNGTSCCNATDDSAIADQFKSMNISDSACSAVVKSVICAKCDPYSAGLFNTGGNLRQIPVLCNSTSSSLSQSKDTTQDYCMNVWDACKDVSISNSPFSPQSKGSGTQLSVNSSKLSDTWQSEKDFCLAFGGSAGDESVCFDGKSASFNTTSQNSASPKGICLERIGNGSYLNMAAHPDGSNRVFLSSQPGKIWLATVPEQGSGGTLEIDEANPFLDITDEVHFDSEFGLMGMAFHPDFKNNGRFFVSYNCDKVQSASCSGRCSCNSDVGCDPSKLGTDNGAQPCQYQSVIAEYTANSSSATPSTAKTANPVEVQRIFTMGLPYTSHHGGQILFGPADGYLYFMMGDGGNKGDPFNFAQNKKSLLGKILRLDVNTLPSGSEIVNKSLWGNYSIPKDNPSAEDNGLQPEIWALGLRNPWRCSFDSARPSYFYCADVGQDLYEEVDLISKGGNYGWRVYEGPLLFQPTWTPGGNTSLSSINALFPVMGYDHSSVNTSMGSASITGGYVYRSTTDPCMTGRYLYADLYALAMWAGTETPENSGNYTSKLIPFACSKNSPIACDSVAGSSLPSLGYIYSFGEDNSKDIFLLSSKGVYRVVRPSLCNYTCPLEKEITTTNGTSPGSTSWAHKSERTFEVVVMGLLASFLFLLNVGY